MCSKKLGSDVDTVEAISSVQAQMVDGVVQAVKVDDVEDKTMKTISNDRWCL